MRILALRIAIAVFALGATILRAQVTTATISGSVTDTSGAVLPGAKITILNEDTGISRAVVSDATGHYSAPLLSVGNYRVTANMEGFQSEVRAGIVLTVGRESVVDLKLSVGSVSQSVEVTGEAPLVETTEATVSALVPQKTIQELPLNGRDLTQLILLNPGVSQAMNGSTVSAFGGFGKKISIDGRRDTDNTYLLDGSYIGDLDHNIPVGPDGALLGVATVQEFQVLTGSFGAQYGRTLGGVFNAVSRSGTNQLHGEAFEFLRNSAMDARDFFATENAPASTPVPAFRRNQFGATLGGPIKKDRTFFFVAYEGMRQSLTTTEILDTLDAPARSGNLGTSGTAPVSPAVVPYLALFPLPNGQDFGNGTAQYIFPYTTPTQDNFGQARIDERISDQDSLFGRFTGSNSQQTITAGFPGFGQLNLLGTALLTLSETHIFSGNLLNVTRFSFDRVTPVDSGIYPTIASNLYSIPGQPPPQLSVPGLTLYGGYARPVDFWTTNRFSFENDINLTLKGHSLQIGGMVERMQENEADPNFPFGVWTFASLQTFLAATPRQYRGTPPELGNSERGFRQDFFALFVQDDWRVTSRLTLNLGLRWEPYTVATEVNGILANLRSLAAGQDTPGNPWWINQSLKDLGPRFGFAWSPFSGGKTAVRGGFGISYIPIDPSDYRNIDVRNSTFPNYQVPITVSFFPNGLAQLAYLMETGTSADQALNYSNLESPHVLQYNFNVQQQVGKNSVLTLGFAGNRGIDISAGSIPSEPPGTFDGISIAIPSGAKVLYPPFTSITYYSTDSNSWYNGLQANFQHRFSAGLQMQVGYTFSKALAESDASQGVDYSGSNGNATARYAYDLNALKGLSGFDVGQRLSVSYSYDFPQMHNGNGLIGHVLSGWQTTGILTAQTGQPFSISSGDTTTALNALGYTQYPNVVAGFQGPIIQGGPNHYFNPAAYTLPGANELGNVGVNTLIGPGLFTWDIGFLKQISLTERWRMRFRAELFNITNHPNFGNPAASIFNGDGSHNPTAGLITSDVTPAREIQLSLNVQF